MCLLFYVSVSYENGCLLEIGNRHEARSDIEGVSKVGLGDYVIEVTHHDRKEDKDIDSANDRRQSLDSTSSAVAAHFPARISYAVSEKGVTLEFGIIELANLATIFTPETLSVRSDIIIFDNCGRLIGWYIISSRLKGFRTNPVRAVLITVALNTRSSCQIHLTKYGTTGTISVENSAKW
ncbi:hypothetical protein CCUS01_02618 [Colletotrichum cuscutae]|uniref:Uncharacterized protein n=1 Tax=Colletotrichum cuscutae TaxID=1209917 RepID=A0AAI9YDU8_9PEZI|nr:hypothetical protein CCUS01_02618 [Colletotrichum cuscutae]